MERFCEDVEVSPNILESPNQDTFTLPIDDETQITIKKVENGFRLFGNVYPAPTENKETLFVQLLEGNLFGQGTMGATLGLTDDGQTVTLQELISDEVSYQEFYDKYEDFLNTLKYWQNFAKEA